MSRSTANKKNINLSPPVTRSKRNKLKPPKPNYVESRKKADSNNNAKSSRSDSSKSATNVPTKKIKVISPSDEKPNKTLKEQNVDVYEFTFDPQEEPPPQKKKKKRTVKPRQKLLGSKKAIPVQKYDEKIKKTLEVLEKSILSKRKSKEMPAIPENTQNVTNKRPISNKKSQKTIIVKEATLNKQQAEPISNTDKNLATNPTELNEICNAPVSHSAADSDLIHSPVDSSIPVTVQDNTRSITKNHNDPLHLKADWSLFEDEPIANSSMKSIRNPLASPWRVEFDKLPLKWNVNTSLKPNMTPSIEASFVNFSNKKHVYTNILPETSEPSIEDRPNKLKQSSILSFIKEVVEKQESKKRRSESVTPKKLNSTLNDELVLFACDNPKKLSTPLKDISNSSPMKAAVGNEKSAKKHKIQNDPEYFMEKTPKKKGDVTFFGFDDDSDVENRVVVKNARCLRPKSRAVLKEINQISNPVKTSKITKAKDMPPTVESRFRNEKALLSEKNVDKNEEKMLNDNSNDDSSQSVHLFEDLDVVHVKPPRKSYVNPKKTTAPLSSDSDEPIMENLQSESEDSDFEDLTFDMPQVENKKQSRNKKKKMKKKKTKAEKEADAWAAGFNSMCEDVDKFPLLVE